MVLMYNSHPMSKPVYYKKRYESLKKRGLCYGCLTAKARPGKTQCQACADIAKTRSHNWHVKNYRMLWLAALDAYGGRRCSCCGEEELLFLTLDHIKNDAPAERRKYNLYKTGNNISYLKLKMLGYPPGRRVMCFNCNLGRHRNKGECPRLNRHRFP